MLDLYNLNTAPRLRMKRVIDLRFKRTNQIIACSLIGMPKESAAG